MSLRSPEFQDFLFSRDARQHGEGYCWPAIIANILISGGHFWDQKKVGMALDRWGLIKDYGADAMVVVDFLKQLSIPHYAESDCGLERFIKLTSNLPFQADMIVTVYDKRVRPGYTAETDPPEIHVVAVMDIIQENGISQRALPSVKFFDPDSLIGGIQCKPLDEWMEWWHNGPASKPGPNRVVQDIEDNTVSAFLIVGTSGEEIWKLVGRPEGMHELMNSKRKTIRN